MMNVPRLERLDDLLANFQNNCSPSFDEDCAIDTLRDGILRRIDAAKRAGRSDHDR